MSYAERGPRHSWSHKKRFKIRSNARTQRISDCGSWWLTAMTISLGAAHSERGTSVFACQTAVIAMPTDRVCTVPNAIVNRLGTRLAGTTVGPAAACAGQWGLAGSSDVHRYDRSTAFVARYRTTGRGRAVSRTASRFSGRRRKRTRRYTVRRFGAVRRR